MWIHFLPVSSCELLIKASFSPSSQSCGFKASCMSSFTSRKLGMSVWGTISSFSRGLICSDAFQIPRLLACSMLETLVVMVARRPLMHTKNSYGRHNTALKYSFTKVDSSLRLPSSSTGAVLAIRKCWIHIYIVWRTPVLRSLTRSLSFQI